MLYMDRHANITVYLHLIIGLISILYFVLSCIDKFKIGLIKIDWSTLAFWQELKKLDISLDKELICVVLKVTKLKQIKNNN